ncbi:hypothetical protein TU65_13145 [Bacillus wiedmannii]|nr:hypothetical protein TU65_13145 [Bacillus wiedmannii]
MILHILNGISWAVATSSIEKAVIDVFHDLVVEKQWHGFRTNIRSLGNLRLMAVSHQPKKTGHPQNDK